MKIYYNTKKRAKLEAPMESKFLILHLIWRGLQVRGGRGGGLGGVIGPNHWGWNCLSCRSRRVQAIFSSETVGVAWSAPPRVTGAASSTAADAGVGSGRPSSSKWTNLAELAFCSVPIRSRAFFSHAGAPAREAIPFRRLLPRSSFSLSDYQNPTPHVLQMSRELNAWTTRVQFMWLTK